LQNLIASFGDDLICFQPLDAIELVCQLLWCGCSGMECSA